MPRQPASEFLAFGGRAGNGHGIYTQPQRPYPHDGAADTPELALESSRVGDRTQTCDEPEKIGRAIVDAYGELARTYDMARRARELEQLQQARAELTLEQRLLDLQRTAKMRHINVKGEIAALSNSLARARAGGRTDPSSVVWGVERLEGRLDAKYLPNAA